MNRTRQTRGQPGLAALGGAVLLLAVVALGSGAGPLLHLGHLGSLPLTGTAEAPDPSDKPHPTLLPDPDPGRTRDPSTGYDPRPLLNAVGIVLVTLLVLAVVAVAVRWWRQRGRRPPPDRTPAATLRPGGPAPERAELARAVERADEQLAGDGTARERVLRCWLRLEEAVGTTGVVRGPGETSAELTRRVLSEHAVEVRTLTELHGLYRQARYSAREVPPEQPDRAGTLLSGIRRDLLGEP